MPSTPHRGQNVVKTESECLIIILYKIRRKSRAYFKRCKRCYFCEAGQGQRPDLPHGSYMDIGNNKP